MTKKEFKKRAIELRRQGYSYNLIKKQIPVSKGTLSVWFHDIPFSPNREVQNRIRGAVLRASEWQRKIKQVSLKDANREAIAEIGRLSKRDLFLLGIGVYIGEGSKSHNHARVINADPQVICLAIRWFEEVFALKIDNFSLTIHLYPDNNIEEALTFWSNITGIPRRYFGKPHIDTRVKKQKKHGMLPYGTAHLYTRARGNVRHGVFLFRKIASLIKEVYRQIN